MILKGESLDFFNRLIKDKNIPIEQHATLEMGVFYLFEWRRLVKQPDRSTTITDTRHSNVLRRHPDRVYEMKCFENWSKVAHVYGLTPIAANKIEVKKSPKTKTKTRRPLRKIN